jgi:hypothetical protein
VRETVNGRRRRHRLDGGVDRAHTVYGSSINGIHLQTSVATGVRDNVVSGTLLGRASSCEADANSCRGNTVSLNASYASTSSRAELLDDNATIGNWHYACGGDCLPRGTCSSQSGAGERGAAACGWARSDVDFAMTGRTISRSSTTSCRASLARGEEGSP